ncbi:MAG: hypothetical protein C0467_10295 [Planctomycetaceae bacterium]|nr:hypothetical protein [Planctomycetaceae bacterium]
MRMLLTVGLVVLIAGCQTDPFTDVSGTVTLDGAPLAEGEIIFLAPDNSVTPSSGTISNGHFHFRATRGAKKVQINATKDSGKREMDGWVIRESVIPERYNVKTDLIVDVKSGLNDFKFELHSK